MAQTVNFGLVNLEQNQYNPEATYNQNLEIFDVMLQVTASTITNTPPTGANGLIVIVGSAGTGSFSGHNNEIAYYYSGWKFIDPPLGCLATVQDTLSLVMWNGVTWTTPGLDANFSDGSFYVYYSTDNTSKLTFDLSNVGTSNEISIVAPDTDYVLCKQKLDATTNPNSTNDSTEGYVVGSMWIDTTADHIYICVNNTASNAIWKQID